MLGGGVQSCLLGRRRQAKGPWKEQPGAEEEQRLWESPGQLLEEAGWGAGVYSDRLGGKEKESEGQEEGCSGLRGGLSWPAGQDKQHAGGRAGLQEQGGHGGLNPEHLSALHALRHGPLSSPGDRATRMCSMAWISGR